MTCQNQALANTFLYSLKGITEIFGIGYRWNVASYETLTLCVGTSAKSQLVEGEIDVIQSTLRFVGQYRANHLANVGNLSARANDNGAWGNYLRAIGILLTHGKAILTRGNIDFQLTAEVAQCLYCFVKTCILTLLRTARPHPVGTQTYAIESLH